MWYLLLSLVILGVVLALFSRKDTTPVKQSNGDCATCDGTPGKMCEQECMMEAATKEIEYFDDEELDEYRGRSGGDYTDDEAEQFREIMTTMQPEEVPRWGRSLVLRGIELPYQVKDEYVMLVEE